MRLLLVLIVLGRPAFGDTEFYQKKYNFLEAQQITIAVNQFYELSEKALAFRAKILQLLKESKLREDKLISGAELEGVQLHIKDQLTLRADLNKFIETYRDRPFYTEKVLMNQENIIKGGVLAIATVALLYDNYALCLSILHKDKRIRRLINIGDKGHGVEADSFKEIVESFHSPEKRELMRKAIEWYSSHGATIAKLSKSDKQLIYLVNLIESSPSVKDIKAGFGFGDYVKLLKLVPVKGADTLFSMRTGGMNSISKVFGNSLGMVQTRNGLLFKNKKVINSVRLQLKPMDVLLEKTPFRLTDKFIPGHFGHVAIWVGTEEELKAAELWNDPLIKPYQKEISEGKSVLEALRNGVQLNTLDKFMDVDDVAVLRINKMDLKAVERRAFRQLGKEYDFNFDVETLDKIVCSELVYQVFTDINWPTDKAFGRYTISPDNVAIKAYKGLFTPVLFYHDGKKVDFTKYKELLKIK